MSQQSPDRTRTERASQVQSEQARAERNRRVAISGGILVLIAAVVAAAFWLTGGSSTPIATPADLRAKAVGNTLVVGNSSAAPVKVEVYEDFQCPYCKQFESQSRDFLHTDAADGKVQVTYKPFNLLTRDDYSARALSAWTVVLQKGSARQALAFHDLLYDDQPYEDASSKPDTAQLQTWAKQSGVRDPSVLEAIGAIDQGVVTSTNAAAQQAGVQGTPTIVVNGKQLAGTSIDDLVAQLEKTIAAG